MRVLRGILLAGLMLAACHDPVEPALGEVFTLGAGERARVDNALVLSFAGVAGDSRCPSDVVCVWAGDALVRLDARATPADSARLELHTNPGAGATRAAAGGYSVELVALEPAPVSTRRIPADGYRVKLRVTRR